MKLGALDHLVDHEQIFRIARALGLRVTDEDRRHELMILGAVERLARHHATSGGSFKPFERVADLTASSVFA